jgi:endonuclease G
MTTQSPGPAEPGCDVPYTELLSGLRRFLRTEGRRYLDDPNITSVGLGDRVVGGRRTDELAVQFTVAEKRSEPEALAALGTTPVPDAVTLAGTRVPTDVLESRARAAPTRPSTPVPGERPGTADDSPVRAARGPAELPTR